MTIDEAIEHAEVRACDKSYAQLAEWLRELRRARIEIDLLKTLRDGFKADAQKYKNENAKLRELVCVMHGELVSCEDNGYICGGHKFDERVRELGIEVADD